MPAFTRDLEHTLLDALAEAGRLFCSTLPPISLNTSPGLACLG